jgi:hypothetical protein
LSWYKSYYDTLGGRPSPLRGGGKPVSEALGFVSNLALVREAKSYPTRERSARNCPPPPCGGGRTIPTQVCEL